MILPNKHVGPRESLLGAGALVLRELDRPRTVTASWDRLRTDPAIRSFDRFILALDLLFSMGLVTLEDGLLVRSPHD